MKQRIDWIDLVKATSVLLVVFMHTSQVLFNLVGDTTTVSIWQSMNLILEPLRMPIFFLVSGMLAASAIRRPWHATTSRTTGILYLYVVWTVLLVGVGALISGQFGNVALTLLLAKSGYWYLFALVLFFVIARALRNQPAWIVLLVAAVPNLIRPLTGDFLHEILPGSMATSMAVNLVFFLAGGYSKPLIARLADASTWITVAVFGSIALTLSITRLISPENWQDTFFVTSLLWIAFGVSLATQLTRNGAPAWAGYVGARTLPIFVLQFPVLRLVAAFTPESLVGSAPAQFLFPLIITAAIAFAALWLYQRPALTVLFKAPAWVTEPHSLQLPVQTRRRAEAELVDA